MHLFWKSAEDSRIKVIDRDTHCDVLVIGCGIAGLATALELNKLGYRTVVACKDASGDNTSAQSAGILTQETTVDLSTFVESLGVAKTSKYLKELHQCLADAYSKFGEQNDWFQCGSSLYFAATENHKEFIETEFTTRNKFKLPSAHLSANDLQKHWPGFRYGLEIKNDFAVDPAKLLNAMAVEFLNKDGTIFHFSPVKEKSHLSNCEFVTSCGSHKILSKHVIWTAGIANSEFEQSETTCASTYVVITEPSSEIAALSKETGIINFWDSHEDYTYGRYLPDGRMLVGGQDKSGYVKTTLVSEKDESVQSLLNWAREHHNVAIPAFELAWRASLAIPVNGIPSLSFKQTSENFSVSATTDGLPNGLFLGRVIARTIAGQAVSGDELFYSPTMR